MKLKKVLLGILSTAIAVSSAISFSGCDVLDRLFHKEDENYSKGLEFKLNGDGHSYGLADIGTCKDTEIVIPATYKNLPVTYIYLGSFYECVDITSIELPESIVSIEGNAFDECEKLVYNEYEGVKYLGSKDNPYFALIDVKDTNRTNYTIHEDTKVIAGEAFSRCENMTSIEIPDGVISICHSAFYRCEKLTSVVIPDGVISIGDYAFGRCENLTYNEYEDVQYLGSKDNPYFALIDVKDTNRTNYTIHEDTKVIASATFARCENVASVEIPSGVITIDYGAFQYCKNLTSVVIGENVKFIGNFVFAKCENLTSITVNEKNKRYKSVGGNLYTKDGTVLVKYAEGKKEAAIEIPKGLTAIGYAAFYGCESLKSVVIPSGVKTIGYGAFYGCENLENVVLPDGLTFISSHAFYICSSLTSIELPDSLTYISSHAFYKCMSLTSIEIPNGVIYIGGWAFAACVNLTIYCGAQSEPSDWDRLWNSFDCPVVWGHEGN